MQQLHEPQVATDPVTVRRAELAGRIMMNASIGTWRYLSAAIDGLGGVAVAAYGFAAQDMLYVILGLMLFTFGIDEGFTTNTMYRRSERVAHVARDDQWRHGFEETRHRLNLANLTVAALRVAGACLIALGFGSIAAEDGIWIVWFVTGYSVAAAAANLAVLRSRSWVRRVDHILATQQQETA